MALETRIKIIEIGGIDFELVNLGNIERHCEDCILNPPPNLLKPYCAEGCQWCSNTQEYRLPKNDMYVYTEEVNINHDLFKPNKLYKAEPALDSDHVVLVKNEQEFPAFISITRVSAHTDSQWFILKNPE